MKRLILVLLLASLFFSACKKDNDEKPGTAHVTYSEWFNPSTYRKDTLFGRWGFNYDQAAPAITQNVLDKGTVLVFAKLLGYNPAVWPTNRVGQLPITISYVQGGTQNDTWSGFYTPGNLRIKFINDNNIYTSISNQHVFRYIVIPDGMPGARGITLSYEEICKMYDIPE